MKTEIIKTSKLNNNTGQVAGLPKNPRFLKDDKFLKLKKSIEQDPEMLELREVLAYDNGGELVVIGGNMRLRACKELGIKEVPCKILPKETPIEKLKAYTIKDNSSFGDWDFDLLANEWDVADLENWGVDVPVEKLINESEEGETIHIEKSLQVIPKKEYILIYADEESDEWEELQSIFKCKRVKTGGMKPGSSSEKASIGTERVFNLKTFKERVGI